MWKWQRHEIILDFRLMNDTSYDTVDKVTGSLKIDGWIVVKYIMIYNLQCVAINKVTTMGCEKYDI